jgi:hypothetical protein
MTAPVRIQNPKSKITSHAQKGQALLELAIFGSLVLLVLGVLVNYGLNADFTQQAVMRSFRQALKTAKDAQNLNIVSPVQATHLSIDDRHIPDASHPFGIGSVVPVAGQSSSPTWGFNLPITPEVVEELPRLILTVNGVPVNCSNVGVGCATAGFRDEANIGGYKKKDGKWKNDPDKVGQADRYREVYRDTNLIVQPATCAGSRCDVRIIDDCEGEIIDYGSCVRQARQIVDSDVCEQFCERGKLPGSDLDCPAVCSQPMTEPWYAQGWVETPLGSHTYTFPVLDSLFTGIRAMGLQSGYVKHTTLGPSSSRSTETKLVRTENASAVSTTTSVNWLDETERKVAFKPLGSTSGTLPSPLPVSTKAQDVESSTTWTTPWN